MVTDGSCLCSDEEEVTALSSPDVVEVPPLTQGGGGASIPKKNEVGKTSPYQGVSN